jgi:hypothetical protein
MGAIEAGAEGAVQGGERVIVFNRKLSILRARVTAVPATGSRKLVLSLHGGRDGCRCEPRRAVSRRER